LYQDKGKKGAEARGLGAGSRIDFSLPAQWTTEVTSYDHHNAVKYISPGKTTYHTTKTVKETLAKRKMDFCLDNSFRARSIPKTAENGSRGTFAESIESGAAPLCL